MSDLVVGKIEFAPDKSLDIPLTSLRKHLAELKAEDTRRVEKILKGYNVSDIIIKAVVAELNRY